MHGRLPCTRPLHRVCPLHLWPRCVWLAPVARRPQKHRTKTPYAPGANVPICTVPTVGNRLNGPARPIPYPESIISGDMTDCYNSVAVPPHLAKLAMRSLPSTATTRCAPALHANSDRMPVPQPTSSTVAPRSREGLRSRASRYASVRGCGGGGRGGTLRGNMGMGVLGQGVQVRLRAGLQKGLWGSVAG